MQNFRGRIAVITGGGTGMGRELARQLTAEGCHVAMCDVSAENMAETADLCLAAAPSGTRVTCHVADVSNEAQVFAFRDAVLAEHGTDHINLLFNNAGIGGGGSFVADPREEWEATFGVCWGGVYLCARAFMPLLVASDAGHIVNTSSINGLWASLGPRTSHTAYSAAKFAVRGFTEALREEMARRFELIGKVQAQVSLRDKVLEELPKQGKKRLLVLCPAFTADCLETIEEIAGEGKKTFLEAGGESFTQIPCLNDQAPYIDFLAKKVQYWLYHGQS